MRSSEQPHAASITVAAENVVQFESAQYENEVIVKTIILRVYWLISRAYLRLRGAEVGKNVRCNGFPYVKIRPGGRLIIGDNVSINASRWANAHVTAGSTNFYVERGATLLLEQGVGVSGTRFVAIKGIEIGTGTLVGAGCLICDSDMHEVPLGSSESVKSKPIKIGAGVFVGAMSIILKGVTIGDGAVIGAGSVVAKSVREGVLAAGNPARVVKSLVADVE